MGSSAGAGPAACLCAASETHTVVPATGDDSGPTDFRITKLDVKNRTEAVARAREHGVLAQESKPNY